MMEKNLDSPGGGSLSLDTAWQLISHDINTDLY